MPQHPFPDGELDWSGDNPGIYLKEAEDGPFVTLALWFRVVLSPHGKGNALLLFEDPMREAAWPDVANFCLTDNEPLARYLVENFCTKFGAFQDAKAFAKLAYLPLLSHEITGDNVESAAVAANGPDVLVELTWNKLGTPLTADVLPPQSATGRHEMYSVFVESAEATIEVNGRQLRGKPFPRPLLGRTMSSAFLALSETWLRSGAQGTGEAVE